MWKTHLGRIAPVAIASAVLLAAACTRSAGTPVTGSVTQSAFTGQQATMEAVRAALLTQTAQAMALATLASPTSAPTTVPPITLATATPGFAATPGFGLTPGATPTPTQGAGCPSTYIVQPGDRLFRIAIDLGYPPEFWENIADANNLIYPWIIYPGDELVIPCP